MFVKKKLKAKKQGLSHRQQQGMAFEERVAALLEQRGWQILGKNVKVGGTEVDLIYENAAQTKVLLIEAKSRSAYNVMGAIVSPRQYQRLLFALVKLRKIYPLRQVSLIFAYRNQQGDVEFVANPCYF